MIRWQIQFASLGGSIYTVNIYDDDYTGTAVSLIGATDPFSVSENDDDDPFVPVKTSTGYVRFVTDDESILTDLMPSDVQSRRADIVKNNVVMWSGFLSQENYTQPLENGNVEIAIPVRSAVDTLKNIPYECNHEVVDVKSLLEDICTYLPAVKYMNVYQNVSTNHSEIDWLVDDRCFAVEDEDSTKTHCGTNADIPTSKDKTSYYEVLEAICSYFGWSVCEEGESLWLVSPASTDCFSQYTISTGRWGVSTCRQPLVVSEFASNDNTMEYVQGKSVISIESDTNASDELLAVDIKNNTITGNATFYNTFVQNSDLLSVHAYSGTTHEDVTSSISKAIVIENKATHNKYYGASFYFDDLTADYSTIGNAVPDSIYISGYRYGSPTTNPQTFFTMKSKRSLSGRAFKNGVVLSAEFQFSTDWETFGDMPEDASSVPFTLRLKWGNKYYNGSSWVTSESNFTSNISKATAKGSPNFRGGQNYWHQFFMNGFSPFDGMLIPVDEQLEGVVEFSIMFYSYITNNIVAVKLSNLKINAYQPSSDNPVTKKDYSQVRYRQKLSGRRNDDYTRSNLLYTALDNVGSINAVYDASGEIPSAVPENLLLTALADWYDRTIKKITFSMFTDDSQDIYCGRKMSLNDEDYVITNVNRKYIDDTLQITAQKALIEEEQ